MANKRHTLWIHIGRANSVIEHRSSLSDHRLHILPAVITAALAAARIIKSNDHIPILRQLTSCFDKYPIDSNPVTHKSMADYS
ncbi:hypothetical protein D3C71_1757120 [compost metagenome]